MTYASRPKQSTRISASELESLGSRLPGYRLTEKVAEDEEFVLIRAHRSGDDPTILVKLPLARYPSLETLGRLKNELLIENAALNPKQVVRSAQPEKLPDGSALLFEDFGGSSLERCLSFPVQIDHFLEIATQICSSLEEIHRHRIIHKDIRPTHVLVHPQTHEVRLTGFRISTFASTGGGSDPGEALIEGTLPYISPEQTGRTNRSVNYGSDLYSLGVMFYEMLTGSLPFEASDPLEWVHCHVARAPRAPSEVNHSIPIVISNIVLRLLAKDPDERYQSAHGLRWDLENCFSPDFILGRRDIPSTLRFPQKLYGREREVSFLLNAFARICEGASPIFALVSGYSGVGKTSIVREIHRSITSRKGLFVSGKFDPHQRDIPYFNFFQPLRGLVMQLLAEPEERLTSWSSRIRSALGVNARLMVDTIPELSRILGPTETVPTLGPLEARNRFERTVRDFIGVLAQRDHPLTLFLDDLQWIDPGSLGLIESLMVSSEARYFFLIGAYRDNEVGPSHPLVSTLEGIKARKSSVEEIVLLPLSVESVNHFISDTLHATPERTRALSELIYQKTQGNPFFLIQFLLTLDQEELLRFDSAALSWRWDTEKIQIKGYTDNVIDFMIRKITRLPELSQGMLRLAACIGSQFDARTLSLISSLQEEETARGLAAPIQEGLIVSRLGENYRFAHDRIQEASYQLIPRKTLSSTHLRIGRILLGSLPAETLPEHVFDVVSHFNRSIGLLSSEDEKTQVARLNLVAGKRSKAATAYQSAATYLSTALSLLTHESWETHPELCFDVWFEGAQCKMLSGDFSGVDELIAVLLSRSRNRSEKTSVHRLGVQYYSQRGMYPKALDTTSEAASTLYQLDLPLNPGAGKVVTLARQLWKELNQGGIERISNLPWMTDSEIQPLLALFAETLPAAYFTDIHFHDLIICQMVRLSLKHGNYEASPMGYITFAFILSWRFEMHQEAALLGHLGYDLIEKYQLFAFKGKASNVLATLIDHWTRPFREGIAYEEAGFQASYATGDIYFACLCLIQEMVERLAIGENLESLSTRVRNACDFLNRSKQDDLSYAMIAMDRLIKNLQGQTRDFSSFDSADFDTTSFESKMEENSLLYTANLYYSHFETLARVISGNYAVAVEAAARAKKFEIYAMNQPELLESLFASALAYASRHEEVPGEERASYLNEVRSYCDRLEKAATSCPENYRHKYLLIRAEVARIENDPTEAMRLYEEAIRSAEQGGFVQNQAIAYEFASRFYRNRGMGLIADTYLKEARACYQRWGANGKISQLDRLYPSLRPPSPPTAPRVIAAPYEQIDFLTVVKALQAISRELVLSELLKALVRIAMEQAGAEKALLILVREGDLRVEAEAISGDRSPRVFLENPRRFLPNEGPFPASVVNYVIRTREKVLLNNALESEAFASDPYIVRTKPKSILCIPIVRQPGSLRVIYLENNLFSGAFQAENITALGMIAVQAAISLENAALYSDLREAEAQQAKLVEQLRVAMIARDDFFKIASHELRTPLTPLKLQLQALVKALTRIQFSNQPTELPILAKMAELSNHQVTRLENLVAAILESSRTQEDWLSIRRQKIDLSKLVLDVSAQLHQELVRAGSELKIQAGSEILGVWDPIRLEQVIRNLFSNALKFGAGKPIHVKVESDGRRARLSVRDFGRGIAREDQERIFKKFERAVSPLEFGGFGLGLYIARSIVEAHGGTIRVESEPGNGALFIVELPLEQA